MWDHGWDQSFRKPTFHTLSSSFFLQNTQKAVGKVAWVRHGLPHLLSLFLLHTVACHHLYSALYFVICASKFWLRLHTYVCASHFLFPDPVMNFWCKFEEAVRRPGWECWPKVEIIREVKTSTKIQFSRVQEHWKHYIKTLQVIKQKKVNRNMRVSELISHWCFIEWTGESRSTTQFLFHFPVPG